MAWDWLPVLGGAAAGAAINQVVQVFRDKRERGRAAEQRSADTRQRLRESSVTTALLFLAEVETRAVAARSAAERWRKLVAEAHGDGTGLSEATFRYMSRAVTSEADRFRDTVATGWETHRHSLWSLGSAELRTEIKNFDREVENFYSLPTLPVIEIAVPGTEEVSYSFDGRRAFTKASKWLTRTVALRDALRREIDLSD